MTTIRFGRVATCVALVLTFAASAQAQAPRSSRLVSTAWLAQHLQDPNLVVLHIGSEDYAKGHIPGARLITRPDFAEPSRDGLTLELPATPAAIAGKAAALGISNGTKVVVSWSDDFLTGATRALFLLDAAGLGADAALLDGGFSAWQRERRPLTTDAPPPVTRGTVATPSAAPAVVNADFVKAHLTDPGFVIVDARDREFYTGERTGGNATARHQTGHIPWAKSLPYSSVVNAQGLMKSDAELGATFDLAGIARGKTLIVYCHIGQQATTVIFAARLLGLNAVLYDGSFEGWSKTGWPVVK